MIKFCSLFSGSSGNSLYISYSDTKILIDAGVSGIRIQKAMESIGEDARNLDGIIVTHEHSDHCKCVGVMSRRFNIPIYANKSTWSRMKPFIGDIKEENICMFSTDNRFKIKDIEIYPFAIPHDASDPVGLNFMADNKKITVATDIGHMNDQLFENIKNSDLLMLESNHDLDMLDNGSYPWPLKRRIKSDFGHLCNDMAGKTIANLACLGIKKFIIGHLSHENNYPELAYNTVLNCLINNGFKVGEDVELDVVLRDRTSRVFTL